MTLFRCNTIPQFKIHQFLVSQGLAREAVRAYAFPNRDCVRITDAQGSAMTVTREAPGKYLFEYEINGNQSTERRYDPAEYREPETEAPS